MSNKLKLSYKKPITNKMEKKMNQLSNLNNAIFITNIISKYHISYIDFDVIKKGRPPFLHKKLNFKKIHFKDNLSSFKFVQDYIRSDFKNGLLYLLTFNETFLLNFVDSVFKLNTNFTNTSIIPENLNNDFFHITNENFDNEIETFLLKNTSEINLYKKYYLQKFLHKVEL